MCSLKVWLFIGVLSMSESQNTLFPNLPVGEYRIIYDAIHRCQYANTNTIEFNLYFSKKSRNTTDIKGNLTFKTPINDDLTLEASLASWGLTGGWIENAFFQKHDKFCSSMKFLGGKAWFQFMDGFQIPTKNCPIPKGTYTTSGFDVRVIDNHNLPKVYFFGKYKVIVKAKHKNNTLAGCTSLDVQLVRPWELPKL